MNEFLDMEDQMESNNDLGEKLDKEDTEQHAMEDLITRIAEGASHKQLNKYKGILQNKYSENKENHSWNATKNGRNASDSG